MTLTQLHYFKALARILHYTRAAEELHIAQPSLSYSISELEKELGVKLFDKKDHKITLTAYGEQFLPYVENALATLNDGTDALHQMKNDSSRIIRLGYFHSISASFIPQLITDIHHAESVSNIQFQFTEDSSLHIMEFLKCGELDIGFCMHTDKWVEAMPILTQQLFLVVPNGHPLEQKKAVTFSDFVNEPMIMLDKTSSLSALVQKVFERQGAAPNVQFTVRECNAAVQHIALKMGVSILPHVPSIESAPVRVIPIADYERQYERTVYLSWVKNRMTSLSVRRVRDYIIDRYVLIDK